jgi:TonB family protein
MTGVLDARRRPVQFPTTACEVTQPVNERPPDDPNSMPFAGTPGPWYVNADQTMWAWGGTPAPNTLRTKMLWVSPTGRALTIAARRLDGDARPVAISLAGGPRTYQASGLEFSTPGCWEITATAGDDTLRFTIDVRDPGLGPSAPAPVPAERLSRTAGQQVFDARWGNVNSPRLLMEAKPVYTHEAMDAGIQGLIVLEAVVLQDGTVGGVTVTRSLDTVHGLDDEAVGTVKKWRFDPGTRDGTPVPVSVEIEMTFTLK